MHYCWMLDEGHRDWGGHAQYWYAINPEGFAEREIHIYPNGTVLSYDRTHPLDEYGGLFQMHIDAESLTYTTPCTAAEFETLWQTHRPMNRSRER